MINPNGVYQLSKELFDNFNSTLVWLILCLKVFWFFSLVYFNSTLVWLIPTAAAAKTLETAFQFHIGMINPGCMLTFITEFFSYFNSTLVWLILGWCFVCSDYCCLFQFHIGMINPRNSRQRSNKRKKFQFHIGMINP